MEKKIKIEEDSLIVIFSKNGKFYKKEIHDICDNRFPSRLVSLLINLIFSLNKFAETGLDYKTNKDGDGIEIFQDGKD